MPGPKVKSTYYVFPPKRTANDHFTVMFGVSQSAMLLIQLPFLVVHTPTISQRSTWTQIKSKGPKIEILWKSAGSSLIPLPPAPDSSAERNPRSPSQWQCQRLADVFRPSKVESSQFEWLATFCWTGRHILDHQQVQIFWIVGCIPGHQVTTPERWSLDVSTIDGSVEFVQTCTKPTPIKPFKMYQKTNIQTLSINSLTNDV